jgi:hypothetical protein
MRTVRRTWPEFRLETVIVEKLIGIVFDEEKAQSCANACLRQLTLRATCRNKRILFRMESIKTEVPLADCLGFLTTRVAEEARQDSVHLTDAEIKQLSFTEETATDEEIAAARAFDDANDTDEFEAKLSKLLRNAFDHDVKRGMRSLWQKHLASLSNHDLYVLVMVDQAGIPRPKPSVQLRPSPRVPQMLIRRLPDVVAVLTTALGVFYFLILKTGWHRGGPPIFGDVAEHLLPSEPVRGAFLLAWLGSMIWLFVRYKDWR